MTTNNYVYLRQGNKGFLRYEITATASAGTCVEVPFGSSELVAGLEDAFSSDRVIEMEALGVKNIDLTTGRPTIEYVQRFVDRAVYAVNYAAQAELYRTSPQTKAAYYNRMAICACKVLGDILSRSNFGFSCRILEYDLNNLGNDQMQLNNWKQLLCTTEVDGITVTFVVDVLYQVLCEHSQTENRFGSSTPVLFVCTGTNVHSNTVATPRLSHTVWSKDEKGSAVVSYNKARKEPPIRMATKHGPDGDKVCWEKQGYIEIDAEEARTIAPRQFHAICAKRGITDASLTRMNLQ